MIYFPTNWGAKEPQNLPNHRVVVVNVIFLRLEAPNLRSFFSLGIVAREPKKKERISEKI